MITIHHLEDSRSQRVLWLLEELGVDYEIRRYQRDPKTRLAPADLKKVHPLGKSPVIEDNGRVIAETGAIIEYLAETYGEGRFRPEGPTEARLAYTYWLHFAEGTMMPQLLLKLFFTEMKKADMPFFAKPVAKGLSDRVMETYVSPNLEAQLDFVEAELKGKEWFAGDALSGADIMMSFPIEAAAARGGLGDRPNLKAFLARAHARPAYQRALEKGGPYAYA